MRHMLVLKSMPDRNMWFSVETFCGRAAKQGAPFPPLLQCHAGISHLRRERHEAYMGAEQGTDYSCKLALRDVAVPGESAALWLEMAAPRAESSRAQCSCCMLNMDAGPQPSRSPWESSWAGSAPAQRDCMESDHPKFLLRHFQAPVFS